MHKAVVGLAVGLALAGSRCSEPTRPEEEIPEAPAMIVISGPISTNAPPQIAQKAWEINSYFDFIHTILSDFGSIVPAINGNIYLWDVPFGSGTVLKQIKAVRRSDKSVDWTAVLNGNSVDGTVYANSILFIGKASRNNRSQAWTFYDLRTGEITHKIAWGKGNDEIIQLDISYEKDKTSWHLANAKDGSGSYRYTIAGALQFTASWRTNGSGSFRDYTKPGSIDEEWN